MALLNRAQMPSPILWYHVVLYVSKTMATKFLFLYFVLLRFCFLKWLLVGVFLFGECVLPAAFHISIFQLLGVKLKHIHNWVFASSNMYSLNHVYAVFNFIYLIGLKIFIFSKIFSSYRDFPNVFFVSQKKRKFFHRCF